MAQSFLPNRRDRRLKKTREKWSTIIDIILKQNRQSKIIKQHQPTNRDFFIY
jgi:hypothetical protein